MAIINGGPGDETLNGTIDNDTITGEGGADTLNGAQGDDSLLGGQGNDYLDGGAFDDTLGAGDDTLKGGVGDDIYLISGDGTDLIVELADQGDDSVYTNVNHQLAENVENIWGFDGGDLVLLGNGLDNYVFGDFGADTLIGLAGDDVLDGGAGDDSLVGGIGADLLDGGDAGGGLGSIGDTLRGGRGADVYIISDAQDHVVELADEGFDGAYANVDHQLADNVEYAISFSSSLRLTGNGLDNVLIGDEGADTLIGEAGDDILDGGFTPFEFPGDGAADRMVGGLGDDIYFVVDVGDLYVERADEGVDGIRCTLDEVTLRANVERLWGLSDDGQRLNGNGLDNTIVAGRHDDTVDGGAGTDLLLGGRGVDLLSYASAKAAALIDLRAHSGADGDTVGGFEDVLGGRFDDTISGTGGANLLDGCDGADLLAGREGRDELWGGAGRDELIGGLDADDLTGGAGRDVFRYLAASDSLKAARDQITDLEVGDKIDLSKLDADLTLQGNQAFVLVSDFTNTAGELRLHLDGANTVLEADLDGDGKVDFSILLTGDQTGFTGFVL